MDRSESIKELATALSKAQAEMPGVKMDAENPFFKSTYATLGAVISTARPVLGKHGLSIVQAAENDVRGIGVETILMHISGEFIKSELFVPLVGGKNQIQEAGKAITYLRRYALSSMLNMYADEDADGEPPKPKTLAEKEAEPQGKAKKASRPFDLETLKVEILKASQHYEGMAANGKRNEVAAALSEFFVGDEGRHQFTDWLCGKTSLKEVDDSIILALHRWLKPVYNKDAGRYDIDSVTMQELDNWVAEYSESEIEPS